jgi:hypothetical protein
MFGLVLILALVVGSAWVMRPTTIAVSNLISQSRTSAPELASEPAGGAPQAPVAAVGSPPEPPNPRPGWGTGLRNGQCSQLPQIHIYVINDPHAKAGIGTDVGGLDTADMTPAARALYQQALNCLDRVDVVDSGGNKVIVVDLGTVSSSAVPFESIYKGSCIQPGQPIAAGSQIELGAMCGSSNWGRGTAILPPGS